MKIIIDNLKIEAIGVGISIEIYRLWEAVQWKGQPKKRMQKLIALELLKR